jgi:hypothetical protein
MIQYARLELPLKLSLMKQEVMALENKWIPHFNTSHYQGNWSVLPLRSVNGGTDRIIPDLMNDCDYKDTPYLDACPTIKQLISTFQCELMAVRLMNLQPGSVISPHKDADLCFEKGEARLHIPLFTNNQVSFYSEEYLLPMKEGECWYVNVNLAHSVSNKGSTDRIHLVIDCMVNKWLEDWFDNSWCVHNDRPVDEELKRKVIGELRMQNTEVSNRLADEMEGRKG